MNWEKIKLGFWGAVVGAIFLAIVGFKWGGWVTQSAAQQMAREMTAHAFVDRLVPFCVAQFQQDPEKEQKLAALKTTNSWQRSDYVKKQGWATILGEKEPDSQVAIECTNRLLQTG